jgi:hypothetical protein
MFADFSVVQAEQQAPPHGRNLASQQEGLREGTNVVGQEYGPGPVLQLKKRCAIIGKLRIILSRTGIILTA